jgi:hypothetical protein
LCSHKKSKQKTTTFKNKIIMKEFLYIFRGGDATAASQSPEAMQKHMQKWMKWMEELGKDGTMLAGQPLETGGVTLSGSKMKRTDGPYAEGKELVGGYLLIKAADINQAVEISKGCPIFEFDGTVEVRPIQQMPPM